MSESTREVGVSSSSREAAIVLSRSFPLIMLFQLATCCAALLACVDGAALGQALDHPSTGRTSAIAATVIIIAAGGLVGALIGLGQIRKWRGVSLGAFVGSLSGLLLLSIYVAPASFARMAASAAVLLLSTIAVRLRSA